MAGGLRTDAPPPRVAARPRRRRRWIANLLTLVVSAGLIAAIFVGWNIFQDIRERIPREEAEKVRAEYLTALRGMEDIVEDVSIVGDLVTDPNEDSDGAGQGLVVIDQLRSHADVIAAVARRPLPEVPTWTDTAEIDALIPIQDTMMLAVPQAETISRRLESIVAYREAFSLTFEMPPLTLTVTDDDIGDLRDAINAMIERTEAAVAALPEIEELSGHRAQSVELTNRLRSWRDEYLDAVILRDVAAAAALQLEMEDSIAEVQMALGPPLEELSVWVDEAIDTLRGHLTSARTMLES